MDDADLAQEREQAFITAALSGRNSLIKSPNGICIWCEEEPVVTGSAFCSAECGEDHHKYHREKKQRIMGE